MNCAYTIVVCLNRQSVTDPKQPLVLMPIIVQIVAQRILLKLTNFYIARLCQVLLSCSHNKKED